MSTATASTGRQRNDRRRRYKSSFSITTTANTNSDHDLEENTTHDYNQLELISNACRKHKATRLNTGRLFVQLLGYFAPILDIDVQARFATLECVSYTTEGKDNLYNKFIKPLTERKSMSWIYEDWGNLAYIIEKASDATLVGYAKKIRMQAMQQVRLKVMIQLWSLVIFIGLCVFTTWSGIADGISRFVGYKIPSFITLILEFLFLVVAMVDSMIRMLFNGLDRIF